MKYFLIFFIVFGIYSKTSTVVPEILSSLDTDDFSEESPLPVSPDSSTLGLEYFKGLVDDTKHFQDKMKERAAKEYDSQGRTYEEAAEEKKLQDFIMSQSPFNTIEKMIFDNFIEKPLQGKDTKNVAFSLTSEIIFIPITPPHKLLENAEFRFCQSACTETWSKNH